MVGLKELAAGLSLSRRVTLSAIVFAFAGAFLYAKFPAVFGPIAEKYYFIGGCFLLGGALQSSVESVIRYFNS
jgi:hypothetical protein